MEEIGKIGHHTLVISVSFAIGALSEFVGAAIAASMAIGWAAAFLAGENVGWSIVISAIGALVGSIRSGYTDVDRSHSVRGSSVPPIIVICIACLLVSRSSAEVTNDGSPVGLFATISAFAAAFVIAGWIHMASGDDGETIAFAFVGSLAAIVVGLVTCCIQNASSVAHVVAAFVSASVTANVLMYTRRRITRT